MRMNLSLLGGLLLLGGGALLLERPFAPRPEKYVDYRLFFPDFKPTEVWEVFIRRGNAQVTVKRTPTGWIVSELYDHPADFDKLREAVGRVARWKDNLPIGRSSLKHGKFAVDESSGSFVSFRDASGEPLTEFYLGRIGGLPRKGGSIPPDSLTFYIRPLPGDEVFLINEFLLGTFSFQPENWIDGRVFDFPKDEIVKVVAEGEERVVITKEGEDWVVQGLESAADPNLVRQAREAFQFMRAMNVADPGRPLEEFGLARPRMTATATLLDGRELKLLVGKEKDDLTVYGMAEGGRYVLEFHSSFLDRLFRRAADFALRSPRQPK